MNTGRIFATVMLMLVTTCLAQEPITVRSTGKQKWPAAEAQEIYRSACLVVQQEFGRRVRPRVVLVLGADKEGVQWDQREIQLKKWNPELFAQGVVMLAFDDLLPVERRIAMTKRTLNWANATVSVQQFRK
jgi:hypothetical protein